MPLRANARRPCEVETRAGGVMINAIRLARLTWADHNALLVKTNNEMTATWEEAQNLIYETVYITDESDIDTCVISISAGKKWNRSTPQ